MYARLGKHTQWQTLWSNYKIGVSLRCWDQLWEVAWEKETLGGFGMNIVDIFLTGKLFGNNHAELFERSNPPEHCPLDGDWGTQADL